METTNNAQKTENKKFDGPLSKTFAVVVSLVLISLTVSANGYWKHLLTDNSYGKMATLMVIAGNKIETLPTPAIIATSTIGNTNELLISPAKGKYQKLENWMIDNPYIAEPGIINEPFLRSEIWIANSSSLNN